MSQEKVRAGIRTSLDTVVARYATQLTASIFAVVGVTGVLMFFHLFKSEIEGGHEWLGLAFAAVVMAHLVRNRRPFLSLLGQARMRGLFLVIAMASLGFIVLAPSPQANPFRQATQRMLAAPINHVAPVLGISPEEAIARLRGIGIAGAGEEESIEALARASGKDPVRLLRMLMAEQGRQ
jgi:hypothetical protein